MKPALLLLPNVISDYGSHELFIPASVDKAVKTMDGLIAESVKAGRRFLSRFVTKQENHEMPLALYNKNTPDEEIDFLLEPIVDDGQIWGLISDCGLPCLADPGSKLVFRARKLGILIKTFVGPSSIFLALQQSGLSGQNFAFNGYLDRDEEPFIKTIQQLEEESRKKKQTQIFMERPYRNQITLNNLLRTLENTTLLCVASELTSKDQMVITEPVYVWKRMHPLPNIDRKNTLFLFLTHLTHF